MHPLCPCWFLLLVLCVFVMPPILYSVGIDLSDNWKPIHGFHAAKCSFLSVQDHGSTVCRYCEE